MPDEDLTLEECHAKVAECQDIAKRVGQPSRRIMLDHIAETWKRICAELKKLAH
jgi:hypothetical protein